MTGAGPSTQEQRVLAAIDRDWLQRTLADLVAVPSLPGREEPAQRLVADVLRGLGAEVDVFTLDMATLRGHPAFSTEYTRAAPLGVTGGVGRGDGPTLLLNAHTDVVPTGDPRAWRSDPFTPTWRGDRLYGRGAADMKGGLAAALAAAKAILDAGVDLPGRVLVDAVVGEEDGGCGTLGSLLHGTTADGAVVLEPTGLSVSPAVAGALTFHITIPGLAAHGCLREEGVSAIERLPVVQRALLDLERKRNARAAEPLFDWLDRPFAICTGRVEGGDWASSEADWCRLEGRYGVGPDEDLDAAQAELVDAVAAGAARDEWLAGHPPTVDWVGARFLPGRTDPDDRLVTAAQQAVRDVEIDGRGSAVDPPLRGQPYGCDMGLLTRVGGIPTVVCGPGDIRQAHAVDEWVDVREVERCARALALLALRFCR